MKTCSKCKIEKPLTDFYKGKNKDGYRSSCKSCQLAVNSMSPSRNAEYYANYREKNREQIRENNRRYEEGKRFENPNWRTEYHRAYYEENKDSINERRNAWLSDTGKGVEYVERRRALKNSADGDFTAEEFRLLCDIFNNTCLKCERDDVKLTPDHVIPLSKGGSNDIFNIQPLCRSCNCSKGIDDTDYRKCSIEEMMAQLEQSAA